MKRLTAITITALLTMGQAAPESCDPTSLEGADIRPGDGGVWIGGDGGVFIQTPDAIDFKNRPLPPDDVLCMLLVGDMNNTTDYADWQGIWIEDIKQPWFLGPVEPGGDTRDNESAQLRYTYCDPTGTLPGCQETITLILRFETIVAVTSPLESGIPWPQPYFLNGITANGMDRVQQMRGGKAPTCWDWIRRQTPEFHLTWCEQCATLGEDFEWCDSSVVTDPIECFRQGESM